MKRKILKQCLSVLVVISVLLTALPITAMAETTDAVTTPSVTDEDYTPPVSELFEQEVVQNVTSAQELEQALAHKMKLIRITADFEIDRTFYITYGAVIYSDEQHTLTRATTFAGDAFVVGQDADGNAYEEVIFSLGGSSGGGENLLVIDGNSQNMTVDVVGSIIFVCSHAQADLYPDLTVTNNKKVGNERALDSAHGLSNTKYIGGAVAILSKDSLMNIYGGIYSNNSVNASGSSVYGGAFYNFATLNVHGGTFENNTAVRAGAFYNYRKLTITSAVIKNNTASSLGGAIYLPSSTGAFLYLGTEDDSKNISVSFIGNSAENAGAIYSAGRIFMNDTLLESNSATESGGAIYGSGNYDVIKIKDSEFKSNTAADMAGAIYISGQTTLSATEELNVKNSDFTENTAKNGGALYLAEGTRAYLNNAQFMRNSTTANGGAITCNASNLEINGAQFTENSGYHGGALVLTEAAVALLNNITADSNTAKSNGGVIHNTGSTLTIYNSNFKNNTASAGSAAYLYTSSVNNIYKTKFIGNSCSDTNAGNAGALFIYTGGTENLLHSCTFIDNTSAGFGGALLVSGKTIAKIYNITAIGNVAGKGGVMYETTASTQVTISGMTVSGNTATIGGPIIWGNTTNAKLFINKSNYTDLDINGELPSNYWSTAIVNKLTVSETDEEIPSYTDYGNESMGDMWDATDVATADELDTALNSGEKCIRIIGNIQADRTFYVTKTTTIFSTAAYKITRANNFDRNIFVVGKTKDGTVCQEKVTLTLGNTNSTTKNLLTFDGNKDNMTVSVIGSALLITGNAQVDLHDNITISNNQNNGNGAAALIEENAVMNIYGGSIENNQSVNGGAIYNSANLNILANTLKNNTAENGGAVYNIGALTTDSAVFTANSAVSGGAVYTQGGTLQLDNATFIQNIATNGAALYVADSTDSENSSFTVTSCDFTENTAEKAGGAIYSSAKNLDVNDSSFAENCAENGGAVTIISSVDAILNNITAKSNTAKADGGFLYTDNANTRINSSSLIENIAENGGALAFKNSSNAKILDTDFKGNSADWNGGALYVCGQNTKVVVLESDFAQNIATDGAAISVEDAYIEFNTIEFTENTADINGGAICLTDCEDSLLSNITANSNTAYGDGGFLYSENSYFKIYNSKVQNNTAGMDGGALALYQQTECGIYSTDFENNIAERNGGAVYLATEGTPVTIQRCYFAKNSAEENGGVIYSTKQSILNLYEANVINNSSIKGGVIYAGSGTQTTVNGITVSGNTADLGKFVYANTYSAVLNINKANYTDSDVAVALDKSYWDTAIAGKLKINETTDGIPLYTEFGNESSGNITNSFDVTNAQELEAAITAGEKYIRITADFEIDRTFHITSEVTIFSTSAHTLTRAADFAGDIFVVGETKDGVNSMIEKASAYLTLGNPASETENLLTIDGNKENMTVEVTGTVIFICYGAKADLHKNITIINCHKTGNERTYTEAYDFSRPNRIGGSVAILSQGALNIYGGVYKNNSIKEEDTSTEEGRNSTNGGIFYNESNIRIYGGTFESNQGARGAIVYNYGIMRILGGNFVNNHSTVIGGLYYSPNSASAHLAIGSTEQTDNPVLIKNNTAAQSAGVIYSGIMNGLIVYGNTVFEGNQALNGNGGVMCVYGMLTAKNTIFNQNTSTSSGGAIYSSYTNETAKTRYVNVSDCTFTNNQATSGGAIALNASSSEFVNGAIATVTNSEFISNTAKSGGAISTDIKSQLTIKDSLFEENISTSEGGVIYAEYESVVNIFGSTFNSNSSGSHGGVISLRSSYLNVDETEFLDNTSGASGGVVYVSYLSSCEINSDVTITNSLIKGNHANNYGGAIYVTRRNIENDTQILTVKNTDFSQNSAGSNGGAILFTGNSESYLTDVTFSSNSATEGGALYMLSGYVELDNTIFTRNASKSSGGAIFMESGSNAVMNSIAASRNQSSSHGGFLYGTGCQLRIYDSDIKNNSGVSGGGMYLYSGAVANIYNTIFSKNIARSQNGGALFIYTEGTENIIHSCKFDSNTATNVGGGMYVSGESLVKMYNLTATHNSAVNGGFMYETKAGTVVDLSGLTVSGNTSESGPIIWGNTKNAILNIDKSNYTDLDFDGEYNQNYWDNAIKNLLTVNEVSIEIPECDSYTSKEEPEEEITRKEPVPVTDVFNLGLNSSDESINSTYDKFERLDNSSNFMSKQTTKFENINGGTVTVDSFIYPPYSPSDNMNVGQGLMIYQAMLYKQAYPQEEVCIDIASYRFSVHAAVNINRNSRYFGYMRNITGRTVDYDKYGFVRIAYLLITAAKMGINVNVIGQIDAYPASSADRNLYEYFTTQLEDPCDPAYVKNGIISDYLNFSYCEWTVGADGKGGTDMMHTKLCAVSHYLDMNGVAHKNAVWTSSANLDGIRSDGANGNWALQTATIVSDHQDIYRVSVNYLRFMAGLCEQEDIIEFQDIVNTRSTEQIDLILDGKEYLIPKDKQLVYLGSKTDNVFELYFTPFGGGRLSWDERYNPYCKYLRELYDSEDYITFSWNAAQYNGGFPLGKQIEAMITDAFHKNRNVRNVIYMNAETFDGSTFDDLTVGKDIGFKSFNTKDFGGIHNKDLLFSYSKDGQRYYVSLLNSCNMHGGSMYYQSNFALVIKETSCADDSVFSTMSKYTTKGDMVQHEYGEIHTIPATKAEHGSKYHTCNICGSKEEVDITHYASDWIIDRDATPTQNGIRHKNCTLCGELLETVETLYEPHLSMQTDSLTGKKFTKDTSSQIPIELNAVPLTFEATVLVPKTIKDRGGVIVGNYDNAENPNTINIELYSEGKIRLFFRNNGAREDCIFSTDIRSNDPVNIAVTVDGKLATLYLDGEAVETKNLRYTIANCTNDFRIGGDNRVGNTQYFKGTIYSVNLFSDVRTAEEIKQDAIVVSPKTDALLYSGYYTEEEKIVKLGSETLGTVFNNTDLNSIGTLSQMPHTIEAAIYLPTTYNTRAGVLVGNYGIDTKNAFNIEIIEQGKLRLFMINNGTRTDCTFATDIRSDAPTHIALTIEDTLASLYVNGVLSETKELNQTVPKFTEGFCIGGDNRSGNIQYFKGTIYSVNLFGDVRTHEEIEKDMIFVSAKTDSLLNSSYFISQGDITNINGITFDAHTTGAVNCTLESTPYTFETLLSVPKSVTSRAGIIIGNNGGDDNIINFEVYSGGRVRFYFTNEGTTVDCIFETDIRSDNPKHIALTVDGTTASLYVDGYLTETKTLSKPLAVSTKNFIIGGDHRIGNSQYFKGTIYSLNMFGDVRTADEIKRDVLLATVNDDDLLFTGCFAKLRHDQISEHNLHNQSNCIIDRAPTDNENGIMHTECLSCKKTLVISELQNDFTSVSHKNYDNSIGLTANEKYKITEPFISVPRTFEIAMQLSPTLNNRAGVLLGNYDASTAEQINVEIYTNGNPRLYFKTGNVGYTYLFKTDIRSDLITHLTFTIDGAYANLYMNGKLTETVALNSALPQAYTNYHIGSDSRADNSQIFQGTIYSVNLFSDVRTEKEILCDAIAVSDNTEDLIFSKYFLAE